MSSLNHSSLAPIRVLSDGRRYKRFVRPGSLRIGFRGQTVTGNLANLSATGLLAEFESSKDLPMVAENVSVQLEVDGEGNTMDIQGTVVRVQLPDGYEVKDVLELAVDFIDKRPAARQGIQKLINYLLVKSKSYKV